MAKSFRSDMEHVVNRYCSQRRVVMVFSSIAAIVNASLAMALIFTAIK